MVASLATVWPARCLQCVLATKSQSIPFSIFRVLPVRATANVDFALTLGASFITTTSKTGEPLRR